MLSDGPRFPTVVVGGFWACNPKTHDTVRIFLDAERGYTFSYKLNDGPTMPVPDRLQRDEINLVAFELLLEHERACKASDVEELTLP